MQHRISIQLSVYFPVCITGLSSCYTISLFAAHSVHKYMVAFCYRFTQHKSGTIPPSMKCLFVLIPLVLLPTITVLLLCHTTPLIHRPAAQHTPSVHHTLRPLCPLVFPCHTPLFTNSLTPLVQQNLTNTASQSSHMLMRCSVLPNTL